MNFGKTIKMFLIDGNPNGRLTCELSNWTGKAYKIPRTEVKICEDRQDLKSTGVYLLFGKNDEEQDQLYIGEAENVYTRLQSHLREKDFWTEVIVFISKDDNLNKAHIKYIENRLYQLAKQAKRYDMINGNIPTMSSISEADRSEMEEYISNLIMIVHTLGHKVFEQITTAEPKHENTLYLEGLRGAKGSGIQTQEGFVVFKGSIMAKETTDGLPEKVIQRRNEFIEEGIMKDIEGAFVVQEDLLFTSPSLAAAVLLGRKANGLSEWRNYEGVQLRDLQS